jgi:hypothetical protein
MSKNLTDIQLSPLLKQKKLEMTAYHEAGHAVMRILLAIPFSYVTVFSKDGKVYGVTSSPDITVNTLENLIILCAGKIAESEWGPQEEKLFDDFETSQDYLDIKKILDIMAHTEELREILLYSAKKETKRVLMANQKSVKKIAQILLNRKKIQYEEVKTNMDLNHDCETSKYLFKEIMKNIQDDLDKKGIKTSSY